MRAAVTVALSVLLAACDVAAATSKNTFPAGSTPGLYESLKWVNITALKQGTGFTGLMIPASGDYYGSITNKSDPTTNYATPPGVITAQYPGSKVGSFSLNSFYWGCLVETKEFQEGGGRPIIFTAENCTVTVSGYKKAAKGGVFPVPGVKADASASFNYIPKDNNSPNDARHMNKFVLPKSFQNLKLVQFNWVATAVTYADSSGTFYQFSNGASLGLIDDVVFSTTSV